MRQEKLSLKDEIQKLNLNQENNHTKIEELTNKLVEKDKDLSDLKEELKVKVYYFCRFQYFLVKAFVILNTKLDFFYMAVQ